MATSPRYRAGIHALLFVLLSTSLAQGFAQEVCTLPASVEAAPPKPVDYVNKDLPTDYLALVLSWSPEHCEAQRNKPKDQRKKHAFQCFSDNRFEWVVHGLWAQNGRARSSRDHPRNCQTVGSLSVPLIKQHLCMVPGEDLMQNEWQAHGTCGWSSPERYFSDIQSVYMSLRRPTMREMMTSGISPGSGQLVDVQAIDVKRAFLKLNPALPDASLRVNVASGNRLKELWVCLTKDLKPMSCPAGGTPDTQRIRIRAPHR